MLAEFLAFVTLLSDPSVKQSVPRVCPENQVIFGRVANSLKPHHSIDEVTMVMAEEGYSASGDRPHNSPYVQISSGYMRSWSSRDWMLSVVYSADTREPHSVAMSSRGGNGVRMVCYREI